MVSADGTSMEVCPPSPRPPPVTAEKNEVGLGHTVFLERGSEGKRESCLKDRGLVSLCRPVSPGGEGLPLWKKPKTRPLLEAEKLVSHANKYWERLPKQKPAIKVCPDPLEWEKYNAKEGDRFLKSPEKAAYYNAMAGKEKAKPLPVAMASIGPASWRNGTINEIHNSVLSINKSDKACLKGRRTDPLPNLREVLAELSNDEAQKYFRMTRSVVILLRESLIDTNEEVKAMTRNKELLEKTLDHIRKDIKLNLDCVTVRSTRPVREKVHDGADDLLMAERMQLLNLKKMLEAQLLLLQDHLMHLDSCRKRTTAVMQERQRVCDLVCSAQTAQSAQMLRTHSHNPHAHKNFHHHRPASAQRHHPPKKENKNVVSKCQTFDRSNLQVDPLGPYTPEANAALNQARDARQRSHMLRRQATNAVNNANNMQQTMHNSVNNGITRKVAETTALKQQLDVTTGETRHALNRSQRYFDVTERTWEYSRGPVMKEDLTIREKLDRPIIKVFQRHPGNNMPEAQEIVKGSDGLLQALHQSAQNIGTLKLAKMRLADDSQDKNHAIGVDSHVVRMRRRKGNHRWVPGESTPTY